MSKRANNTGSIVKKVVTKNGIQYDYWEAKYVAGHDPQTGKVIRKSITGKTQKEVATKLKSALSSLDAGTYFEPTKMTVSEWLEKWLNDYAAIANKILTVQTYRSRINQHILPILGATKLSALNPTMLQSWANSLTRDKGLSGKTAVNVLAILNAALKQAVRLNYIQINPCEAVNKPRVVKREIRPLSEDEIKLFLTEIDKSEEEFANLFKVTMFTGLREGEVAGLPWDAVDFKNGTITIRQQLQKGKEKGDSHYISTTKNDRSRTITAPDFVMKLLEETHRQQNKNMLLWGTEFKNEWNLVFTHADGSFIPPQSILKHFKKVAARIGRPDARFHDLRHTYAVTALQEGDDVKTVQENLGHATASFTLDVYGHVSEKMKNESKNRMDKYIASVI